MGKSKNYQIQQKNGQDVVQMLLETDICNPIVFTIFIIVIFLLIIIGVVFSLISSDRTEYRDYQTFCSKDQGSCTYFDFLHNESHRLSNSNFPPPDRLDLLLSIVPQMKSKHMGVDLTAYFDITVATPGSGISYHSVAHTISCLPDDGCNEIPLLRFPHDDYGFYIDHSVESVLFDASDYFGEMILRWTFSKSEAYVGYIIPQAIMCVLTIAVLVPFIINSVSVYLHKEQRFAIAFLCLHIICTFPFLLIVFISPKWGMSIFLALAGLQCGAFLFYALILTSGFVSNTNPTVRFYVTRAAISILVGIQLSVTWVLSVWNDQEVIQKTSNTVRVWQVPGYVAIVLVLLALVVILYSLWRMVVVSMKMKQALRGRFGCTISSLVILIALMCLMIVLSAMGCLMDMGTAGKWEGFVIGAQWIMSGIIWICGSILMPCRRDQQTSRSGKDMFRMKRKMIADRAIAGTSANPVVDLNDLELTELETDRESPPAALARQTAPIPPQGSLLSQDLSQQGSGPVKGGLLTFVVSDYDEMD
ncbi:hypothetical protein BLNAU_14221 [Blattamonas nauphoetae]|uniref:Transmembrane protein n=1 Tax=Blattamonas nauphoetae TaxID=2049346 RepID=A0ABQ9XEA8_9EUKA|nr:hypothetical protein BLNAU_14221 [Blattamonas nauphoetae]